MKLIKLLVSLTLINTVVVVGMIGVGWNDKSRAVPARGSATGGGFDISTPSITPSVKPKEVATPTQKPTVTPAATPVTPSTPTPTPTPVISGCIVSLDGVKYEVTSLRRSHSGGDIFVCGSDMSQEFWREHNGRILQKMQQYRVN